MQKVSFFQALIGTWKWEVVLERVASSLTDYTGSTTLRSMTIELVDHLFDLFDSEDSGKIDAVELKSALEKIGNRMTRAKVLAMMTVTDENDDGEVDCKEFHNLIIRTTRGAPPLSKIDCEK
jgi:Ca2+-binding EF-hand superfamily protein